MEETREARVVPAWSDIILLLSLDLTSLFTTELRLDRFHSEELRQLAREVVPEVDLNEIFDCWFTKLLMQGDSFQELVLERLGQGVLQGIAEWGKLAYAPKEPSDIQQARPLLRDLVRKWDESDDQHELPLNGRHQVHLRTRIRDYVTHGDNVVAEIDRADSLYPSQWDQMIDLRCDVPKANDDVWLVFENLHGQAFWEEMGTLVSETEAAELGGWMQSHARREGIRWHPPALLRTT